MCNALPTALGFRIFTPRNETGGHTDDPKRNTGLARLRAAASRDTGIAFAIFVAR
jgi:hypothetical protein